MDQADSKWFKMVQKDSKQDQSGTNWFNENIKIFEIWRKSKMTKLIVKNLINILNCIKKLLLNFLSRRDLTFSLSGSQVATVVRFYISHDQISYFYVLIKHWWDWTICMDRSQFKTVYMIWNSNDHKVYFLA